MSRTLTFRKARENEIESIYSLYVARCRWMDDEGIDHWNHSDYLEAYDEAYYLSEQRRGRLYVLEDSETGHPVSAAVLFEEDDNWEGQPDKPAFYIHNLVADRAVKGSGRYMLSEIEKLAAAVGKAALRLDCSIDNEPINRYYESLGFMKNGGEVNHPFYHGILREKTI